MFSMKYYSFKEVYLATLIEEFVIMNKKILI